MYPFLLAANTLLWLLLLAVFVRSKTASVFHPFAFYLAFHFLVFVLRPPLVYFRGYDLIYRAYEFVPTMSDKNTALLVTMVGLASFAATNLATVRSPVPFERTRVDDVERSRLLKPFLLVMILLVPLGFYSLAQSWLSDTTGVERMITDAATGTAINTQSNGYIYESRLMLGPIALLFAWLTRFRWYSFVPLGVFLLVGMGTGTRGPVVLAVVAVGLAWLFQQRQRWPTPKAVIGAASLVLLFSAVGADRGQTIRGLFVEDQVTYDFAAEGEAGFLEGMDAGNLEFVEYLVYAIPARTGTFNYFVDNLQVLTEPVPRVLWKDKPIGAPVQLYNLFDYGYPIGMTNSLPGEGWAALGYLGVIIWCGLFGWIWGRIYEWFARGRPGTIRLMTYLTFLPLSILFFRDGALISMMRFGLFLGFPLLLLYLIVRLSGWRRPEPALAGGAAGGSPPPDFVPRALRGAEAPAPPPRAYRSRLTLESERR